MATQTPFLGPDLQAENLAVERQRRIAQGLAGQAQQPIKGQMVGDRYVAPSGLQALANLFSAYAGKKGLEKADQDTAALYQRQGESRSAALGKALSMAQGTPGELVPPDPQEAQQAADYGTPQVGTVTRGGQAGNPLGAYSALAASGDPMLMQAGGQMLSFQQKQQEGEENRSARMAERIMQLDAAAQNAALSREERAARAAEAATLRRDLQASQQAFAASQSAAQMQFQDQQARQAALDRQALLGQRGSQNVPKLPTSALKLQQEELEAIGTAAGIDADLGGVLAQLSPTKDPKTGADVPPALQLGLASNVGGRALNYLGMSTDNSRNLGSFEATLEKLRNDSLRLNKGVQTEGDAVRAWNEILKNINDQDFVKKRLGEVRGINQRAVNLRRMQVDAIRSNFGVEPMDVSGYTDQQPTVGTGGTPYGGPERRQGNADPLGLRKPR